MIAKELVVYPAFEKYITSGGKEVADKDREEHLVLKKELDTFQGLEATARHSNQPSRSSTRI